jgi:hypothetical protein
MRTYRKKIYIKGYGFLDTIRNVLTNIPYKKIGATLVPLAKKATISLANSASERVGHNIGSRIGDTLIKPRTDPQALQQVREQTLKDLELVPNNSKNRNKVLEELKISEPPIGALYSGNGLKKKKKMKGGMIKYLI